MTRFTPYNTGFSLFLLDKNTPRFARDPRSVRDDPDIKPPVWRRPQPYPHTHEDHEINIVTGGTCRYIWHENAGACAATVSLGEMFVIPGGVSHVVEVDRYASVRGLWIHPQIVAALGGADGRLGGFTEPPSPRLVADPAQNTVLQELFEQAQAEYARPGGDRWQAETLRTLGRLAAITFVRLMAGTGTPPLAGGQSPAEARVAAVRGYIDRNYAHDLSLREMADKASLSPSQFSFLFRKQTGESPKAYLLTRRLRHAAALLADSDLPVLRVAGNAGFAHLAGFNHRFKAQFGVAPGEYRKKAQNVR